MSKLKINKEDAILVLIDYQERLMPAMKSKEDLEAAAVKLIKGCGILGVPSLVTQQYTKGLGPTVPAIHDALGKYDPIEKTSFSAMGEPNFVEALKKSGKKDIILAGIESHVCILQTALDLIEEGYRVFLVIDAISSRNNSDKKYAQRRMSEAGAIGSTSESILFEMLGGAREAGFKEISALVK